MQIRLNSKLYRLGDVRMDRNERKDFMIKVKRRRAIISRDICVACGSCEDVCPKGAARVVRGSYAKADASLCIGCGRCEMVCPAGAIAMEVAE